MFYMENKTNEIMPVILLALLIVSIIGNFYLYNLSSKEEIILPEITCPETICEKYELEDKALLDVQLYEWAENIDDPDEMFFNYWIHNYGDVEAKNIKVVCNLWDESGLKKISTVEDSYGNLASRSSEFGEVVTKDIADNQNYYIPLCHVESCDNCEILYKRNSDLIEMYEGY